MDDDTIDESEKLSSDRLLKFRSSSKSIENKAINKHSKNEFIFVGDVVSFMGDNGEFYAGQILKFQYETGSQKDYSLNFVPIKLPDETNPRGIELICNMFHIQDNGELTLDSTRSVANINEFYSELIVTRTGLRLQLSSDCLEIVKKFL